VNGTEQTQLASGLLLGDFGAGPNSASAIEWSPDGRFILLSTLSGAVHGITVAATDGSSPPRFLDVGMGAEGPTWRPPDGREILFRGTSPSGFGLYAVRPDGTGLRSIVSNGQSEWDALFFGWSPAGDQVAYQWLDGSDTQLIYVVPADGGAPRSITSAESVGVQWSPDGTKIAYIDAKQDPWRLAVIAADGSGPVVRGPAMEIGSVQWAPDGSTIVVQNDGARTLLDPVTGAVSPITWSDAPVEDWQRLAP
jgi:Tol biopolymer transport system component